MRRGSASTAPARARCTVRLSAADAIVYDGDHAFPRDGLCRHGGPAAGHAGRRVDPCGARAGRELIAFTPLSGERPRRRRPPPPPDRRPRSPPTRSCSQRPASGAVPARHLCTGALLPGGAAPRPVRQPLQQRHGPAASARGQVRRGRGYFRRAVASLTLRNPNPYDGEPSYHLGRACAIRAATTRPSMPSPRPFGTRPGRTPAISSWRGWPAGEGVRRSPRLEKPA